MMFIMAYSEQAQKYEAHAYADVQIEVHKGQGIYKHQAALDLMACIGGLKEDLTYVVGVPADDQEWYYNDILLDNERTLMHYGIDGRSKRDPKISIKIKHG